jgi:hypothetical protein
MRKLVLGLVALLSAGTVFTVSAQELDWPIDMVMEKEAADVEVCQDFICTKLREEILVEAAK